MRIYLLLRTSVWKKHSGFYASHTISSIFHESK